MQINSEHSALIKPSLGSSVSVLSSEEAADKTGCVVRQPVVISLGSGDVQLKAKACVKQNS